MKVTYLGKKDNMIAHGYDFEDGSADVPETDKRAISKFIGNRYFHCEHPDNVIAPKFYVHAIQNIRLPNDDLGNPRYRRIRGTAKGKGFGSVSDAEEWVKRNGGKVGESHYIKKSNEGISDAPESLTSSPGDDAAGPNDLTLGIFRMKTSGDVYATPDKTFAGPDKEALKADAREYMKGLGINPEERKLLVK